MTRFLTVALLVLTIAAVPAVAHADTVTVYDWTVYPFAVNATAAGGTGGPFGVHTVGPLLGTSDFMTFCLELDEHVSWGSTYNFTLSDSVIRGGGEASGGADPLSNATKFLYYQTRSGDLKWYTDLNLPDDGNKGANIQYAIWSLEGELTAPAGSAGATLAKYALDHEGDWDALAAAGNRVYAMNLTTGTVHNQSMLALSTVPEPGSLLLFGTGLVGVARAWRKRRG